MCYHTITKNPGSFWAGMIEIRIATMWNQARNQGKTLKNVKTYTIFNK